MKAILVLEEMPSKCNECPMSRFVDEFSDDNNSMYCFFNRCIGAKYKSTEWDADRPQWCPLKPMEDYEKAMENIHRLEKELFE